VRVDVDALAFGLLEQILQVLQVVPGNQDALSLHRRGSHFRRLRVPVRAGIAGVQHAHGLQVYFAHPKRHGRQCIDVRGLRSQERQRLVEEGIELLVLLAENHRVIRVGRHAFQAVQHQSLKTCDVRAQALDSFGDPGRLAQADQLIEVLGRFPRTDLGEGLGLPGALAGLVVEALDLARYRGCLADQARQALGVEVDVRHRREQRFENENVNFTISGPKLPGRMGVSGDVLGRENQQVLQGGRLGILSAYAVRSTSLPTGRLLTLVTEHAHRMAPFSLGWSLSTGG